MFRFLDKYFHLPTFLISLAFGLFIVYIQQPDLTTIFVYPNPDNQEKIQYKDRADNCYKFSSEEVECPQDEMKIREYPVQ